MSYDVYVGCHSCGADLIRPHGHNNLTSNLAAMWTEAGAPLADMHGMQAAKALPKLQRAIDNLKNYPEDHSYPKKPKHWVFRLDLGEKIWSLAKQSHLLMDASSSLMKCWVRKNLGLN